MKVALYARISTRDKGQDTENQLLQLRQFCRQQGWEIAGEYIDQKTGRTSDREAFQRLFQHAYEKRYDLCLFWALDRFSREGATDTLQHLRKLSNYGVQWKSFTEQYIDSAGMFGEVIISLLDVLAKQESVRRSERDPVVIRYARGRAPYRPSNWLLSKTERSRPRLSGKTACAAPRLAPPQSAKLKDMAVTFEAVYENGVLRPLESLTLPNLRSE